MALTRIKTELSYRSEQSGQVWHFTVGQDQSGGTFVGTIRSPFGTCTTSTAGVPGFVIDDINTAFQELEDLVATTSAVNAVLTYAGSASQSLVFTIPFSNNTYGVTVTLPDFLTWKITNKLTTGFTLELGSNYSGDIRVDVFV